MPRTGRPPKPTALKLLAGNPGRRPLNEDEPRPEAGPPPCPAWMHKYAKAEWRRVTKLLNPLGLVTKADLASLAGYCESFAELRIARELLAAEGHTCETATGGVKPHPAISMQRTALAAMRQYMALFGLDPSSRSKLHAQPQQEADPFEELLSGKRKGG